MNLTLYENFGLTTIEAGASGLPVVVTRNGGPSEIIPICQNGILVDPLKPEQIKNALISILTNESRWKKYSNNGIINVQKKFSWQRHVEHYLGLVKEHLEVIDHSLSIGQASRTFNLLKPVTKLLITDIDGTLILPNQGNPGLKKLASQLHNRKKGTVFALASGRNLELVLQAIDKNEIPVPDIIVSSVGSEIHYFTPELIQDKGWANFLNWRWKKDEINSKLNNIPWLELQESDAQRDYKISYIYDQENFNLDHLKHALGKKWHQVNIITSHKKYLDILPKRASKGQALKFICQKWSIPMDCVYAAGDSGNDLEMFRGSVRGIIVGNRSQELDSVKSSKTIYLAQKPAAEGIVEGLTYYGFEF